MIARTFMSGWQIAAAIGLACLGFALPAAAQSIECPIPQPRQGPGILKESPAKIAEIGTLLASGDSGNRAPEVVADLRKRYPGASNAEIENYLITAYCPVAAKLDGLSVAERKAKLNQFAHQASVAVYGK